MPFIVVVLPALAWLAAAEPSSISNEQIINALLNASYDFRVRPPSPLPNGETGPTNISVNVYLRSISNIDFVNMQYNLQITFREKWTDPRLAYAHLADDVPDFIVLSRIPNNLIWMPDTFFQNEKQAHRHMIDAPNMLVRIHPDGRILFSERISLVLSCPMQLESYPFDQQRCVMDFASYAYTTDDLAYRWDVTHPIQLKPGLTNSLPTFWLSAVTADSCTSKTSTGEYSCLRATFSLQREFSYYLLQVYVPSILLVIVSWVSFWLEREAVPARVTLGVTTLLSMTTQAASINQKLPPVSYVKAIDIWIAVCLCFIFGAVLEYAYVSYLASVLDNQKRARKACEAHQEPLLDEEEPPKYSRRKGWSFTAIWREMKDGADSAKMIDVWSRVVFPLLFGAFNLAYWLHYGVSFK